MSDDELYLEVKEIMEENGFFLDDDSISEELYFDSLQFVSTLVSLENKFNISIPTDYLNSQKLNFFYEYVDMVKELIKKGGQ